MKTTLLLTVCFISLTAVRAQDASYSEVTDTPPVTYTAPVVYEAPVVYQAPVTYYAPVYYLASAAAATASYAGSGTTCSAPSTVIHITGGRGTYSYSRCANEYESTVIYIGSRQPRVPNYRLNYRHY